MPEQRTIVCALALPVAFFRVISSKVSRQTTLVQKQNTAEKSHDDRQKRGQLRFDSQYRADLEILKPFKSASERIENTSNRTSS